MSKLIEGEIVVVHEPGIGGIDLRKGFRWRFRVHIIGETRSCTCMSSCIRRICMCRRYWHVPVLRELGAILPLLMGRRVLLYTSRSTDRRASWRFWPRCGFTTRFCPQLLYYCSLAFLWTSLLADGVECAVKVVALAAVAWPAIVASHLSPSAGITR